MLFHFLHAHFINATITSFSSVIIQDKAEQLWESAGLSSGSYSMNDTLSVSGHRGP